MLLMRHISMKTPVVRVVQQVTAGWSVKTALYTNMQKEWLVCESQASRDGFIRGLEEASETGGKEVSGSYHY